MANVVKKINDFNDKQRINHAPVIIKRLALTKTTDSYVLLACTKAQITEIFNKKDITDLSIIQPLIDNNIITSKSDIKQILYGGNLHKFKNYENYVYKFPMRKIDILQGKEPQYRYYIRTLEQQKNVMWLVNLCNSASKSWESAIQKVGSDFGLFIKVTTIKP